MDRSNFEQIQDKMFSKKPDPTIPKLTSALCTDLVHLEDDRFVSNFSLFRPFAIFFFLKYIVFTLQFWTLKLQDKLLFFSVHFT